MNHRLGRKPSKPDNRTLRFRDYVKPGLLGPPPLDAGWYTEVYRWPMYANDSEGDCVIAAWGHLRNLWTKYATGIEGGPTLADILAVYNHLSPGNDGVDMLTALRYATKTGLGGKKIRAYAALTPGDVREAELCVSIFGAALIGLELPDAITNSSNMLEIPWAIPAGASTESGSWAPNPNSGHCVIAPGYREPHQNFEIVTWGAVIAMSDAFYNVMSDEAYLVISDEWIERNGKSPSGFDLEQLLLDRESL